MNEEDKIENSEEEKTTVSGADEDALAKVREVLQRKAIKAEDGDEEPQDYKYIKVKSLDELQDRVGKIRKSLDENEDDVYDKLKFPLRLGMLFGAMAFFLTLGVSFFSELHITIVAKRSFGAFFLFCFLGWLTGLVLNYFSPRIRGGSREEEEKGTHVDYKVDENDELEQFKKAHESADLEDEDEDKKLSEHEVSEELKKVAKDEPETVARAIKGVMTRNE